MVSQSDRVNLVQLVEQAILESHTDPLVDMFGGPRIPLAGHIAGDEEPKGVARLIFGLPTALQAIWQRGVPPAMAGRLVEVGGRFCHTSPKVRWSGQEGAETFTHAPELADLLVTVESNGRREALLVQAKAEKANSNPSQVTKTLSDDGTTVQRYMYAKWPRFKVAKIEIAPHVFDPSIEHDIGTLMNTQPIGAAWALVTTNATDRANTTSPVWLFEEATPLPIPTYSSRKAFTCAPVTFDKSLADVLASMMLGECRFGVGYGNADRSKASPHGWPELIEGLIEFSKQRTSLASKGDYLKHLGISMPASTQVIASAAKSYENTSVLRFDPAGNVSACESVATLSDTVAPFSGAAVRTGIVHRWDKQLAEITYHSEHFDVQVTDANDVRSVRDRFLEDALNPLVIPFRGPPAPPTGGNDEPGTDRSRRGFAHLWIKLSEPDQD